LLPIGLRKPLGLQHFPALGLFLFLCPRDRGLSSCPCSAN